MGHAGRAGIAGIVWLFFEACQYLERSREPGRRLARPMEFSRTRNPSRPKRASETQGKRARFKENVDQQSSDYRDGKGVNPFPAAGDSLKQPFAHHHARPSTQAPRAFGR